MQCSVAADGRLTALFPTHSLAVLGMDVIDEHDAGDFKLFFLAYGTSASANAPTRAHREAILELTWNKGTEKESGQV